MAWKIVYAYIAAKPFRAEHPLGSGIIVEYQPGDVVPASEWGAATGNMLEMGKIFQTAINVEVPDSAAGGGLGQRTDVHNVGALPDVATEDTPTRDDLLKEIAELSEEAKGLDEFPKNRGGGNYVLSDGTRVRGKGAAVAAQAGIAKAS